MARSPTDKQLFEELLVRFGQEIAEAFRKAIEDLTSAADLQRFITAVQAGDIEAAIRALHLDPAALGPLQDAIQQAYAAAGQTAAAGMPTLKDPAGAKLVIRFNARNVRAEAWLRDHSSELVTRILEDQRTAVRTALVSGMVRGAGPRTVALEIVGRVDRSTGKRQGGIIGLTSQQERFADTARDELASGDPEKLRNYLTRKLRDRRFDPTVKKAIEAEKPVPAAVAAKAVTKYKSKLLKHRGDTIGRTEALTSLRAAKHETYLQAVESGSLDETAVRRTWRDVGDLRVRHTHSRMDGDTVGLREPFKSPSGARLLFPGDTSLGAPAAEIIACRCDVDYRIDFLANIR